MSNRALQQIVPIPPHQLAGWNTRIVGLFVVICLLLFPVLAFSQPIIEKEILPTLGDTLLLASDDLAEGIVIFPSKGIQEWDFMDLQSAFSKKIVVKKANRKNSPFPAADIIMEDLKGVKNHYHLHDQELKLLGSEGVDPFGLGMQLSTNYETSFSVLKTPIEYGDVTNSSGRLVSVLSAYELPIPLLYSLPILPDSVRFISTVETSQEADAWGHLVLPDNSFEVLRERRITAIKTRLEVKVGLFAWRDITDDIYTSLFPKEKVQLSYHFYSNETSMPVAVAYMKQDGLNVASIDYLVSDPASTMRKASSGPDIYAYPNPAINEVRFAFSDLPAATYKLKIFNILGMSIMEEDYQLSGYKTIKWDVSKLRKGTYLYSLVSDKGKTIATRRLMVIRP